MVYVNIKLFNGGTLLAAAWLWAFTSTVKRNCHDHVPQPNGIFRPAAAWFSAIGIKSSALISLGNSKILFNFKWSPSERNDENCLGIRVNNGNWFMYDLNCWTEYYNLFERVA